MGTDYRAIYDHVMATNPGYMYANGSPGYQWILMEADRVRAAGGPALDVGCGMGFAVELLRGRMFRLDAFGVDVSHVAVERGNHRMNAGDVLRVMQPGRIPHADAAFNLVTCFDVLEHLDEADLPPMRDEIRRVLRPGGLLLCSAATRPAVSVDQHGDNLHRTIRPAAWWCDLIDPDEARWLRRTDDLLLAWKKPA